jgi:hypothetical protein
VHTIAASTFKTALSEFGSNQTIVCYPNPFNDKLNIEGLQPGKTMFELYNLGGQLMHTSETRVAITSAEIDLVALPSGFYLIKILNGEQSIVKKILKN